MFFYAFPFFQLLGLVSAIYLDTNGMSSLEKGKFLTLYVLNFMCFVNPESSAQYKGLGSLNSNEFETEAFNLMSTLMQDKIPN